MDLWFGGFVPFANQVVFFRADRAGRLQSYMLANLQFHPIVDYDY